MQKVNGRLTDYRALVCVLAGIWAGILFPSLGRTQTAVTNAKTEIYEPLKSFALTGGTSAAENLTLKRDRGVITFQSGTFYFSAPVEGQVRGAVFIGTGSFHADVPPSDFERENVNRLLKADVVESDFKTAVMRFTDDTFSVIGRGLRPGTTPPGAATKLAAEFERRFLKETGANVSARLAISIMDKESPGFFVAEFDKGKRGRFTFLMDQQCRIPVANFRINAGEKGLIFAFDDALDDNDVWIAFHGLEDYQHGEAPYSDLYNLVETPHYDIRVDLREPKKTLRLTARMDLVSRADGLRALPFALSEDLPARDDIRRKKGLHVISAQFVNGASLDFIQEEWEGGLTLLLPAAVSKGQKFSVEIVVEGEFMRDATPDSGLCRPEECLDPIAKTNYPRSNETWYPRHGYLERSTFDLTFLHPEDTRVASAGRRLREDPAPRDENDRITEFRIDDPIPAVTFAIGPFELRTGTAQIPNGPPVPLEVYSLPERLLPEKMPGKNGQGDLILAELSQSVRYFSELFGPYPYPVLRAVFHPFDFGQGFPTMILIPEAGLIAHETSHQWWGDVVPWRSYRDQWLSEGFAEYSNMLLQSARDKQVASRDRVQELRTSLKNPPKTPRGIGKGRLVDIGPIVLGHRLSTRESGGAYTTLVYNKGALVLHMLHFLFTDPQTGDGTPFFDMMSDFVRRNQNGTASTESFFSVANDRVSQTPLAKKYGYKDLNWFLQQWVFGANLPSYRLEYQIENHPDGKFAVKGTVIQEGIPEKEEWFMPLPLVIHFGGNKVARGTVAAYGAKTPVNVALPVRPEKIELDPDHWILSEKTVTQKTGR